MPSITAIPVPVPAYVYVEADFSDVGTATAICVDRVHPDGSRFPLRPYVSYDTDGCLNASCGLGIWWDTELPFDTAVTYCATGNDAAGNTVLTPAPPVVADAFTRVTVASWGTSTSGLPWTTIGGAAGDYATDGTRGVVTLATVNVARRTTIDGPLVNGEVSDTVAPAVVALGSPINLGVIARRTVNSEYIAEVSFDLLGAMNLRIRRNLAGVFTTLATVALAGTYTAATRMRIVFRFWGSTLSARAWDVTTPDPVAMQATVVDTSLASAGAVGTRSIRDPANANGSIAVFHDDFLVTDVCAAPVPLEVCSAPVTIAGDGCFRLGDPVRPCNDRTVCLAEAQCPPEGGIFFGSMGDEEYPDNSGQLLPVNASRAITVNRERRDTASQLNLVTGLFTDRDDLLELLSPGSPLLWRGPAEYGTGDRYMSVFDVGVSRSFPDHREQPRVFTMPWTAEDPPVGPSLGVCGTRIMDMCDVYPTLDAMVAAGLSYADLLRGSAGTGVSVTMADWNDVNADFADWNALNAAEADWTDTLTGFP